MSSNLTPFSLLPVWSSLEGFQSFPFPFKVESHIKPVQDREKGCWPSSTLDSYIIISLGITTDQDDATKKGKNPKSRIYKYEFPSKVKSTRKYKLNIGWKSFQAFPLWAYLPQRKSTFPWQYKKRPLFNFNFNVHCALCSFESESEFL